MHYSSSGIYFIFTDGLRFTICITHCNSTGGLHTIYGIKQSVYASRDVTTNWKWQLLYYYYIKYDVIYILYNMHALYLNINKLYVYYCCCTAMKYVYNTKYIGLLSPRPYIYTRVLVESRCVNVMFFSLLTVFLFFNIIFTIAVTQ